MMKFVTTRIDRTDDEGATMVEYGLLVSLISIAAVAALLLVGTDLLALFNHVATAIVP